jgi:hypothetical protein
VRKDADGLPPGLARGELQWLLFNDTNVAFSKDPPLEAGFVYLYRRADA